MKYRYDDPSIGVTIETATQHEGVTVSLPYQKYLELLELASKAKPQSLDKVHMQEVDYIHSLLAAVESGDVTVTEEEQSQFYFFTTPLGKFMLKNWELWKAK